MNIEDVLCLNSKSIILCRLFIRNYWGIKKKIYKECRCIKNDVTLSKNNKVIYPKKIYNEFVFVIDTYYVFKI